jgi:membrane protein required for colicin V production
VNLLDVLLAIILVLSVVTGYIAGFARVGIGFIAVISGLLCGFWFYGIPAAWFHKQFSSATISNLLGFFIVFFGFLFAGALLGKLLSKLFKWTGLSWLDHALGGVFGLARGGLIGVIFVAVLLAFTPKPLPNWMVDSKLLPYAIDASNWCSAVAPNAVKEAFRESMRDVRKAWDDQLKKKKEKERELKKETARIAPHSPDSIAGILRKEARDV